MQLDSLFPEKKSSGKLCAIGELLIEFLPSCENQNLQLDQLGTMVKTVSGSSGIFACAAAELGADTAFIGKVGTDSFSRMAIAAVQKSGVCMDSVVQSTDGNLGLSFLEYHPDGSRAYIFYRNDSIGSRLCPEELDEQAIADAQILHFPGMLLELSEPMRATCLRAVELAKKHHVLLSFDPNIRKELKDDPAAHERMLCVLRQADMIEPTLEEARYITGCHAVPDVLRALHAMGPKLVVLTCDKNGAIFYTGSEAWTVSGIHVPVCDTTGAGDTFAAALCYCVMNGFTAEESICFCNCAATHVCGIRGTIGLALPKQEDVRKLQARNLCSVKHYSEDELDRICIE